MSKCWVPRFWIFSEIFILVKILGPKLSKNFLAMYYLLMGHRTIWSLTYLPLYLCWSTLNGKHFWFFLCKCWWLSQTETIPHDSHKLDNSMFPHKKQAIFHTSMKAVLDFCCWTEHEKVKVRSEKHWVTSSGESNTIFKHRMNLSILFWILNGFEHVHLFVNNLEYTIFVFKGTDNGQI